MHKLTTIALKATKTLLKMHENDYNKYSSYDQSYLQSPYENYGYNKETEYYKANYVQPQYRQVPNGNNEYEQNQYGPDYKYKDFYEYIEQYEAPYEYCPFAEKPICDSKSFYRTIDGSCNNLQNPWWGKRETPFKRLLEAAYTDIVDEPRKYSKTGKPLPNARFIAMNMHDSYDIYSEYSSFLPHFGQFLDHDITLTALVSEENGEAVKCFCGQPDPDCVNIQTPSSDEVNQDQRCQVVARSSSSFKKFNCNLGKREQLNVLTHWLDASQVYGVSIEDSAKLRLFQNGRLQSTEMKGLNHDYLPYTRDGSCSRIREGMACFGAGDSRINQNLQLVTLHTIFLREHNRIADILLVINPHWNDEKLFLEARRINAAVYQHIVYNEFLPVVLGEEVVDLYNIKPYNQDYFYKYNPELYPNIINEFSAAAFRFGHTLVRTTLVKTDLDYHAYQNISLQHLVFDTNPAFKKGGLDALLRGMLFDGAGRYDPSLNSYLNNHLFEGLNEGSPTKRFSLASLNINRARDHGIQPYIEYRALCGLNYPKDFSDLYNIPKKVRLALAEIYDDVGDIDLFTGGISERPIEGGLIGATFACNLNN